MQEQDLERQQPAETPIAIKSAGLSAEAKGMFDMIAKRAYEIFESKGRVRGRDLEHWLQAEAELFERTPINLKETRDGVIVRADVRGFMPKELEVDLEPKRVTIIGKHQSQTAQKTSASHSSEMRATRLLRSLQLPVEIDTKHATARLERGVLELDVRKALAGKGNTGQISSSAKTM
ncbi:MAG TPA: Hsp20 family protein [Candidatus Solibacter sp.]|nr:Hsp20 family protein [Candidatus Solibacter sp.]